MTRKALWIVVVLVVVLLPAVTLGYWMFPRWKTVADVTKRFELVLHARSHQNSPYGIEIHAYGQIEGEAELVLLAGGAPNRVFNLSGVVDVHFTGDWYSEEAELEYRPIHVSSGSLNVRYKFFPWYPTDPI